MTPASNTSKRDVRLKRTLLNAQSRPRHGSGHAGVEFSQGVEIALETSPDDPGVSTAELADAAGAQAEGRYAGRFRRKRVTQRRQRAFRKLSKKGQCDVHGVRRHPPHRIARIALGQ